MSLGPGGTSRKRIDAGGNAWRRRSRSRRAHRDNRTLVKALGHIEHQAYARYASYGLLPLVRESIRRTVEFELLNVADIDGTVNADLEPLVVLLDDGHLAQRFFRQYAEAVNADPKLKFTVVGLTRGVAALGNTALLTEDVLTRTRKTFEEYKSQSWIAVAVAMLQYRAEKFAEAQATLAPFSSNNHPQVAFLDAAIAFKLEDEARSRRRWSDGETRYRELCRNALTSNGLDVKTGIFNEHWWQFGYGQAMRRLAAETMSNGQPSPDDPWQRLIQARGYRLIGEIEKSDAELAAAVAAVPDDPDVWLARARLLDQWDKSARTAEDAWQRAVELAGDDPLPLIHRGRWYAERGEHEKADADFAKAASLTPDELNKFLEAGWWVVGPYSANLDEFCPPEIDADPSTPVYVIDPKTGLSDEPVRWQSLPTANPPSALKMTPSISPASLAKRETAQSTRSATSSLPMNAA